MEEIDRIVAEEGNHPNLEKDPKWITHHSFWWGWDRVNFVEGFVDGDTDIAVGRLEGFRPEMISEYPVFKDPDTIRPGTSRRSRR